MEKESQDLAERHCDDYIRDPDAPIELRSWLLLHRLPARDFLIFYSAGFRPELYADFEGTRVRIVMASRLGDVGITSDLTRENGYDTRVKVSRLTNFSNRRKK